MTALLQALLFAATAKFAMVGFVAGDGISDANFRAVSDSLAGELRNQSGGQLITSDEIKSLLSVEEQKQMVGCTSESCFAEIGGALGAERIISGSIGKVGKSWMLVIKAINSKKVGEVKQVTRRIKDGSIDDVLDVLAPAVRELLGGALQLLGLRRENVEVERLGRFEDLAEDRHVLAGSAVTLVVAEEVAIALLLVVAAAGDDVHR